MDVPLEKRVSARYDSLVFAGEIERDPAQEALVARFDALLHDIGSRRLAKKSSSLGWLFARKSKPEPIRGLYIHGEVGRGKTMLMDLFFELVPARRKRRAHFNDFMADAHQRIHEHRQKLKAGETKETDPIPPVADALVDEAWVLCFDEFTVTDIADAMILSRLFGRMFEKGCVLIATSNVQPDDLYRDGLNRQLFLPFVTLLKSHVNVLNLDARTDYRLEKTANLPVYNTPLGEAADRTMDRAWSEITAGKTVRREEVAMKGRSVEVPRAAAGAARFSFADLCERPLGASDYMAIAKRYHTIFIDHVPLLGPEIRNQSKRFILLIDTLYDKKIHLILSAAAPAADLMPERRGTEGFEFDRTASRLMEMQSHDYVMASRAMTKSEASDGDDDAASS